MQKLMALGVLPGAPISLVRRSPSVVFQVGYSQFAVDEELARGIHVRLEGTQTPGISLPRARRGCRGRKQKRD
jgi:DtxR family Mn-dependent transcriptional regulator